MKRTVFCMTLALACSLAVANEPSVETTISEIQSYPEYGSGDVIFKVANPGEICKGYWLAPSTPGFDANLSLALSAFHSASKVRVWGHTQAENKWGGSSTHLCKLYSIKLVK